VRSRGEGCSGSPKSCGTYDKSGTVETSLFRIYRVLFQETDLLEVFFTDRPSSKNFVKSWNSISTIK
jgi:hypothetical protein